MTVFRDLSQHILDIAENSLTAGATELYLDIREDPQTDRLGITVRDNGRGIAPEMLTQITDPWVTTRTTRKVGLGIPFLKQTAEMCDGSFEITSEPGQGTRITVSFRLSHIDRPPLGDLVGTLLCLIVGNPDLDLVYTHVVGERSFTFDTRQIREVLGPEVPLSDPEVLAFVRETLYEGLQALGSEAVTS